MEYKDLDQHVQDVKDAFDGMPILRRLDFVSDLIFGRVGSLEHSTYDPTLALAHEVLFDAINVLRRVPDIENVGSIKLNLG